jgi:hypothetical protein
MVMAVKVRFTGKASGFDRMALPGRPPVSVGDIVELDAETAARWVANGNFALVVKRAEKPEPAEPASDGGQATEAGQKKKGDA